MVGVEVVVAVRVKLGLRLEFMIGLRFGVGVRVRAGYLTVTLKTLGIADHGNGGPCEWRTRTRTG